MGLDVPRAASAHEQDIISNGYSRSISPAVLATPLSAVECQGRLNYRISELNTQLLLAAPGTEESVLTTLRRQRDALLLDLKSVTSQVLLMKSSSGTADLKFLLRGLAKIQWTGHAFDTSSPVYPDLVTALTYFEDVLQSASLAIDEHWFQLMPPLLAPAPRVWFSEFVNHHGEKASWTTFKAAIIARFGVSVSDERSVCDSYGVQ